MRENYQRFTDLNCEVLSIGPEGPDKFRAYWSEHAMPFPGLADPKHRVAKLYGQAVRLLKLGRLPLQLVIDEKGMVVHRHDSNSMKDVPSVDSIIRVIEGLAPTP